MDPRRAWTGVILAACFVWSCERRDSNLGPPAYLSSEAHTLLRSRMHRHANDASDLLWAVLELDAEEVEVLATRISNEPRLSRPTADTPPDVLNAALPSKFFVYQEDLRERAEKLAAAARSKNNEKIAAAFSQMVEKCVACHDTYVNARPGQ